MTPAPPLPASATDRLLVLEGWVESDRATVALRGGASRVAGLDKRVSLVGMTVDRHRGQLIATRLLWF